LGVPDIEIDTSAQVISHFFAPASISITHNM